MDTAQSSLHDQVEKWFGVEPTEHVRVAGFGHMTDGTCYVHIAASSTSGSWELYFFRHDDGGWRVFPQRTKQPSMTAYRLAA
jgi:hypothetical protein